MTEGIVVTLIIVLGVIVIPCLVFVYSTRKKKSQCSVSSCNSRFDPRCATKNCTEHCRNMCGGRCLDAWKVRKEAEARQLTSELLERSRK